VTPYKIRMSWQPPGRSEPSALPHVASHCRGADVGGSVRAFVLDPGFVADCPYGPGALLIDDIVSIDRDAGTIVARMPTRPDLPITRDQRTHPERHPAHVAAGLMIHATGILGFAHAYFVLDLRCADGWIGYGTHIHNGRFRRMGKIGDPMLLACTCKQTRRIQASIFARYAFRFTQSDELIYESEQSAVWSRVPPA
jgi:hypothetical protein